MVVPLLLLLWIADRAVLVLGCAGVESRADHDRPARVNTLEHETIVDVACGAFSTMAITANGRVYQFGMVHKPISEADAAAGAASGRLIGVHADPTRQETLEHVMRWSTNKWAMAEEEVPRGCFQTAGGLLRVLIHTRGFR
jgi:hypothetical protein